MKDPEFDDNERLLMAEVALRLEPRLGAISQAWTEAIPLAAPPEKIPGMRRTLAALGEEFAGTFFRSLIAGGPHQALVAQEEFCERLIRRRLPETGPHQRLTMADLMRAARLLCAVVDREISRAFGDEGGREADARLAYARQKIAPGNSHKTHLFQIGSDFAAC